MAMAVAQEQQQRAGASASSPPRIRILDSAVVRPSPLPSGSAPPECSLPLTFFDIFWLSVPPVERLFLYRLAPDADVPAILSNLKTSLSQAVRVFYPLAGRLRLTPGTSNRYELYYRPGDGVAFTVAEYDAATAGGVDDDIDGLATDDPREVARIAPLVPPLPAGGAVLALQATLLPGRRGLAVGVTVHHAACDGSGSTHFLHTWAAATCARADAPSPPRPVIDRSLLADPRGLYDVFCRPAPATTADGEMVFFKAPADQLLATFTLSKDDVQRVKDAVAAEAARRGVAPPRCTSLVATLGFVWSCYLRAKDDTKAMATSAARTGGDRARACLLFPVDHRSRMKPPLPDNYLGNCIGPALCLAPREEVAAAGAGGLFSSCAAVAAAINEAASGIGTSSMDAWGDRIIGVASSIGMLSVAGSPRFRVYDLDLGFGRPEKVDIVSVAKTGAVAVAESRHSAGGMEVGVSLPRDGMDRFHKCFADAIAAGQNQS
ncbi:malonyl-CoA:anthocyanidin 5-O-glucoside-6''-O-malonyltransferase-like [Miscanthus floridulus]|uniref:malonyl-CoA:anthocyanidin 5-O-glucoside-6''-O-malonyltransferase-like n=1 Tax=Miscanthus floridulus TaxID=154761 RepID=UPI003457E87A